jgi:hypothetical protein
MSCQLHVPATFLLGIKHPPPYRMDRNLAWPQIRFGRNGECAPHTGHTIVTESALVPSDATRWAVRSPPAYCPRSAPARTRDIFVCVCSGIASRHPEVCAPSALHSFRCGTHSCPGGCGCLQLNASTRLRHFCTWRVGCSSGRGGGLRIERRGGTHIVKTIVS